MMPELQIHT